MSANLNWGIIGAGNIARSFARGLAHAPSAGRLIAIASRSQANADLFGDEMNVPRRYGNYAALLEDADVSAVYIATPHPEHKEWAIRAANARKHLLCEKPLGVNAAEAMAIIQAARENDIFLMEAFMYRCHPQIAKVVKLVKSNAIGGVRMIQATFGFRAPYDPAHRLWCNALAGGGILDVGCYPVSFARLIAGAASGKDFLDPLSVTGAAKLHDVTGIDEFAAGTLKFENGVVAQVAASVGVEQQNVARIYGTAGSIYLPQPWTASVQGQPAKIFVYRDGEGVEEIRIVPGNWLYAMEAEVVAANIARRQATPPGMTWDDTLGNMRALDQWRAAVGLIYEAERAAGK